MDGTSALALLGLLPGGGGTAITAYSINRAFRAGAQSCHPDHGGDPVRFRQLCEARTVALAALVEAPSEMQPTIRASATARASWFSPPVTPRVTVWDAARPCRAKRAPTRSASSVRAEMFGDHLARALAVA